MFCFDFYEFNRKRRVARFYYTAGKFKFTEELDFSDLDFNYEVSEKLLNNLLFFLHLLLGISYYKLTCEKEISVKSGCLDQSQADFFNNLYTKGLGEFFYKNNINFKGLINFPVSKKSSFNFESINFKKEKLLVPLGGGKDSAVVLSLLNKEDSDFEDFDVFTLGESQIYSDVAKNFGNIPLKVVRKIDPLLFKINGLIKNEDQFIKQDKNQKFYNGHIPISGIIAGVSLFVSAVSGYRYIVLANESSANVGNTVWKGMEINHQYSKSLEFEESIQSFILKNITDITYFSLLRPFTELKISKLFSTNCEDVFFKFNSCNKNFKINKSKGGDSATNIPKKQEGGNGKWCGICPKCAFVFVMLSPFLGVGKVSEIFGKNLFKERDLVQTFKDLIGFGNIKPLECVGTRGEVQAAFSYLISHPSRLDGFGNSVVIKEVSKFKLDKNFDKYLDAFDENLIPQKFLSLIK